MTPFDLILHFSLVLNVIHLYVEFELSSFNRPQDIRGQFQFSLVLNVIHLPYPKIPKVAHVTPHDPF